MASKVEKGLPRVVLTNVGLLDGDSPPSVPTGKPAGVGCIQLSLSV